MVATSDKMKLFVVTEREVSRTVEKSLYRQKTNRKKIWW